MDNCKICYETMTSIVYYQTNLDDCYNPLGYCYDCLTYLMENQWNKYKNNLKNVDCEASLKRLIEEGPPLYFKDACIENNSDIRRFKYQDYIISGQIKTVLTDIQMTQFQLALQSIDFNHDYLTALDVIVNEHL